MSSEGTIHPSPGNISVSGFIPIIPPLKYAAAAASYKYLTRKCSRARSQMPLNANQKELNQLKTELHE